MENSIFLVLFGSCLSAIIPIDDIPENLYIYQNLTNISDDKLLDLYRESSTGVYSETYPKFHYQLSKGPPRGTVSPVVWNDKKGTFRSFRGFSLK